MHEQGYSEQETPNDSNCMAVVWNLKWSITSFCFTRNFLSVGFGGRLQADPSSVAIEIFNLLTVLSLFDTVTCCPYITQ
jgi:hypothetical protein